MSEQKNQVTFEASLKKLEQMVAFLEKGEAPIEEQLKTFEQGVSLSRECLKELDSIEKKVQLLLENDKGDLVTKPFDPEKEG